MINVMFSALTSFTFLLYYRLGNVCQGRSKQGRLTLGISYEDCYAQEISHIVCKISVCDNEQNFKIYFSTLAVAQWVRDWSSGHRVVQPEDSSPDGDI